MVASGVVAVVGSTAAGKSALGVALARALGGEVVNADSMQLYQGMDIGTAKLTVAERQGTPHHLLDVWPVTKPASVAEYQGLARGAIDDIARRNRVPVVVGGSGLYVRAALDRLEFPGTDASVRARLEAELAERGSIPLYDRLRDRDPLAAESILPSNGRRIVRALEAIEVSGSFSARLPAYEPWYDAVHIGLGLPRDAIDARIDARVDRMWGAGFVDEVRALEAAGLREGRTASRALGYRQVLGYLAGECSEEEARDTTVRATRRFARRQDSWFRRDPRVHWIHSGPDAVDRALQVVRASHGSDRVRF